MLFAILFAAISGMLIWTTIRGRDAFPFSHYPMFSDLTNPAKVEVFRIELQTSGGSFYWWKSRFYRYPEYVGRRLKEIYYAENDGGGQKRQILLLLEKRRYLREVLRLIEREEGTIEPLQNFRIVKRTVAESPGGILIVIDEVIETISVGKILKNQS